MVSIKDANGFGKINVSENTFLRHDQIVVVDYFVNSLRSVRFRIVEYFSKSRFSGELVC